MQREYYNNSGTKNLIINYNPEAPFISPLGKSSLSNIKSNNSKGYENRFSRVKKLKHLENKQKEENWNDRFFVGSSEVNLRIGAPSIKFQRNNSLTPKINRIPPINQKPYSNKYTLASGIQNKKLHNKVYHRVDDLKEDSGANENFNCERDILLKKLIDIWNTNRIFEHHRSVFTHFLEQSHADKAINLLENEINDISEGKAPILMCMKAIKAREICLSKLISMGGILNEKVTSYDSEEKFIATLSELLADLRILSINSVYCIEKWRRSLYLQNRLNIDSIEQLHLPFYHEGINYLIKITKDFQFLQKAPFSTYFSLGPYDDYFLKSIVFISENNSKAIPVHFIQKSLLKKIDFCENLIKIERQYGGL